MHTLQAVDESPSSVPTVKIGYVGGVTPLVAGELPPQVRSMVERHVTNQETLVEAGFTGNLDLAFQAFLNEPLVDIPREDARDLFAELVETEREYFAEYDLDSASVLD